MEALFGFFVAEAAADKHSAHKSSGQIVAFFFLGFVVRIRSTKRERERKSKRKEKRKK